MEELEAFYDDRKVPIPEALEEAFSGIDVDDDGASTQALGRTTRRFS